MTIECDDKELYAFLRDVFSDCSDTHSTTAFTNLMNQSDEEYTHAMLQSTDGISDLFYNVLKSLPTNKIKGNCLICI